MINLENKKILITGATGGIGNSLVKKFTSLGSTVLATGTNDSKLQNIKKDFPEIIIEKFDLANHDKIEEFIDKADKKLEGIDVLVNNAGIIHTAPFQMTSKKRLKEIFEVNFFSQCLFTQLISKSMIKNKSGSIINMSSISAYYGNEGRAAYSSSKAALETYSKTMSRELGKFNVRVNIISPGLINTDMLKNNTSENIIADMTKKISLGKIGEPDQIANIVLFLASDLSNYITGQNLKVDGGM